MRPATHRARDTPEPALPRTVFQYWDAGLPLAPCLQNLITENKARHPGWRFELLSRADAPRLLAAAEARGVAGLSRAFDCIHSSLPQARADVLRYIPLLLYGGVYLDIKVRPNATLDEIFFSPDDALASDKMQVWDHASGQPSILVSWGMAAPAGHPMLIRALRTAADELRSYPADNPKLPRPVFGKRATTLRVGPLMLSRVLEWDASKRICRAPGVHLRAGSVVAKQLQYDGTGGCYYGANATARRVRRRLRRRCRRHRRRLL